jgi:antitoxin YefM
MPVDLCTFLFTSIQCIESFSGSNSFSNSFRPVSKKSLAMPDAVQDNDHMKAITYTAARETLASTIQRVCEDHDPVVITRRRDQAVVMMSLADYESLEETAYLSRSPKNASRLRGAIEQLRAGNGTLRKLPELT